MNKIIRKANMVKSRLKNKYMKNLSEENTRNYTRQISYCVKLLRKEKENFFANPNTKNISDKKIFWQTVKSFSQKKPLILKFP